MGPSIDRGAGIGHNIGQALLMLANMTGPGRAANAAIYGPGIHHYEAEKQSRAAQLAALKDEEAIPTEELRGLTGLAQAGGMAAYRGGQLGINQEKVDVSRQRADTQAQAVANHAANDLQRVSQGWQRLDLGKQQLEAKKWFDQQVIQVANSRVAAGQSENDARIQATEDVKSALSQNQFATQHPIMNWLGLGPDIQAAPGAQPTKSATGATPAAKPNAKPAAKAGGLQYATDPSGKLHSAPAGTKLPQGWKAAKGPQ
jgi:hypothetical protein